MKTTLTEQLKAFENNIFLDIKYLHLNFESTICPIINALLLLYNFLAVNDKSLSIRSVQFWFEYSIIV